MGDMKLYPEEVWRMAESRDDAWATRAGMRTFGGSTRSLGPLRDSDEAAVWSRR